MNPPNLCLEPDEAPGEGIRRIAREQIEVALAALGDGSDPAKAVHEARKALKKLRATFRLVACEFGARRREKEKADFREAARLLGPLRDAEVGLRTLDTLVQTTPAAPAEFSSVRAALQVERDRVVSGDGEAIRGAVKLLEAARKRIRGWPVDSLKLAEIKNVVRRTYRKGRRALADYRNQPGAETFHEWRKRVKELWYQLRILKAVFAKGDVEKRIKRLKKMGELAGDAHDLDFLRASVQKLTGPGGVQAALMIGEIDARTPEFYAEALRRGGRFYKSKPGAFMEALEGK